MFSLLKQELLSRWSVVLGWGIGLALFGALYAAIFPEMADQITGLADLSVYEVMGMQMATFEGFLASTSVLFTPVILGVYAILAGARTLAGEEDDGTLELLVTTPLARWHVVTMKALALGIVMFLILLICGLGNAAVLGAIDVETDVTAMDLLLVILSGWPITMAATMIGLFLGAFLPSRRIAAAAGTVVFIIGYFSEGISGMVESLRFIRHFSLFAYFDTSPTVFSEGVKAGDVFVLLGVVIVFLLLAVFSFQRRNLTVGAWPWQR